MGVFVRHKPKPVSVRFRKLYVCWKSFTKTETGLEHLLRETIETIETTSGCGFDGFVYPSSILVLFDQHVVFLTLGLFCENTSFLK